MTHQSPHDFLAFDRQNVYSARRVNYTFMTLKNRSYGWLAGSLVVLAWLSNSIVARGQAAESGAANAVLLTVSGKVEVATRGETVWTAGHTNQVLRLGDRLRTGKNSRATLRLSNLSVLRVYELTTLEIQPPEQPGRRAALDLEYSS